MNVSFVLYTQELQVTVTGCVLRALFLLLCSLSVFILFTAFIRDSILKKGGSIPAKKQKK